MFSFDIYSPEEEIFDDRFSKRGLRLFIKRDDMIHPFISGNKWRKLKYSLLRAKNEGKEHLVTFGGVWSNHLLATACAAARFGFKSTGIVRGEDVETDTLLFCRLFGMNLIFVDRQAYRNKSLLFDTYFSNSPTAFFIDEGGAGPEAARGCAELVEELRISYGHIFCAAGTGTTAGGLLQGLYKSNRNTTLHAIGVLKGAGFLSDNIRHYSPQNQNFIFHQDYHFGGYAGTTPALIQFIATFSATTGILLDPVYTGKMMYAIYDLADKNFFSPETKILAIHTGGLFGLLGMKPKINAILQK